VRILDVGWRARAGLTAIGLVAGVAGLMGAAPAQAATTSAATAQSATAAPATPPHIMTIMMENTDYSQFVGSPAMPYLNEIAHEYADFTDAWGWTYPSLPNYLELLSGSDDGVGTTDTTSGNDCDITQAGCNNFKINLAGGKATAVTTVRDSNGYGQVISHGNGYVAVGAAYQA
jgi:hypothetical protein